MCDPGTAAMVSQGAGAVTSAAGSIFSAKSTKMGLNLDAYFADLNNKLELDAGREAMRQGEIAEVRQRLETGQIKSRQRAAMGANNVDLSTGSALDRQVTTDYMGEIDANTIRQNAAREAAGHRINASGYRNQATTARAGARSINPMLAGVTSLVGSAGHIASDWYRLNKEGAFSNSSGFRAG